MAEKDDNNLKQDIENEEEVICQETEESKPEPKDRIGELESKLEEIQKSSDESHDRLMRATAEFDNYKKRSARDMTEFRKFANESLIKDMLPVLDNLERAITSSTENTENAENAENDANEDSANSVVEGVKMVLAETLKILEKFNVKKVCDEGKPFDPNFHQAVMQEETEAHAPGTVLKVLQNGYILHDRLIRPAMVVVSKAK